MIDLNKTKLENFDAWYAKFPGIERAPMDMKLGSAFVQMTFMDARRHGPGKALEEYNAVCAKMHADLMKVFGYQILEKRGELVGLKITIPARALLAMVGDRPGVLVQMVYVLRGWQARNQLQEIGMEQLGIDLFPTGFPTSAGWRTLWDAQKLTKEQEVEARKLWSGGTDNFLDYLGNIWV